MDLHPYYDKHITVSLIPISRTGEWVDETLSIHFKNPRHTIVQDDADLDFVIKSLLKSEVSIDDCQVVEDETMTELMMKNEEILNQKNEA